MEHLIREKQQKVFYTRHLPHYNPPGAALFLTFRLAGSIPNEVLWQLQREFDLINQQLDAIPNRNERKVAAYLEQRKHFGRWDSALDAANHGPIYLAVDEIANLVKESIHHRDGKVYKLHAYCIMSNHVHVLFTPLREDGGTYYAMSKIMQSLKGYTAYEANRLLGRSGQFWQDESYDHAVRDADEYQRIVRYILNNPVKAGLVKGSKDWPWSYVSKTG